nr:hypothetical protein CFP56_26675 [Quercus suber]
MERSQTKYQIVLTKTYVVFPIDVARRAMQIEESLKVNKSVVQPLMMVSSKSGAGIGYLMFHQAVPYCRCKLCRHPNISL